MQQHSLRPLPSFPRTLPIARQHFERYFGADVEGWGCPAHALNVAADGCEQAGKEGSRFWLRLDLLCPESNEAAKVEALVAVLPGGKIEVRRGAPHLLLAAALAAHRHACGKICGSCGSCVHVAVACASASLLLAARHWPPHLSDIQPALRDELLGVQAAPVTSCCQLSCRHLPPRLAG